MSLAELELNIKQVCEGASGVLRLSLELYIILLLSLFKALTLKKLTHRHHFAPH